MRMDYYKKYQEIIADYNREKDRATVEATSRSWLHSRQALMPNKGERRKKV